MRNNVKYPRNRETFGGWFGPYQWLVVEPGQCVTGVFFYFKTKKNSCLRSESYISAFLLLSINTHQFAYSPSFWDRAFPSRVLFFWPSELHRNEMVDCFENFSLKLIQRSPIPKIAAVKMKTCWMWTFGFIVVYSCRKCLTRFGPFFSFFFRNLITHIFNNR